MSPAAVSPTGIRFDDIEKRYGGLYALRRVFLEYQVGRDGPVRTIPVQDAASADPALAAVAGAAAPVVRPR